MKNILIFIPAYNAADHITRLLKRTLSNLPISGASSILLIDDASDDDTAATAEEVLRGASITYTVIRNPYNLGYGGTQKIAYQYAINHDYDIVVMLHGDAQYAPECLQDMVAPFFEKPIDAVFGSRMLNRRGALKGGMPYYKFIGNIVVSYVQNHLLKSRLSEFHTGYRAYSTQALREIPFRYNSNYFDFDTDIIIQLLQTGHTITEISVPTHYGREICHVNGFKYVWRILATTWLASIQKYRIYYDKRFDYHPDEAGYRSKLSFHSSHTFAVRHVKDEERVLELGTDRGFIGQALKEKGCTITGIDRELHVMNKEDYHELHMVNLEGGEAFHNLQMDHDVILLLDVLEHIKGPESFLERLSSSILSPSTTLVITTPNIAFILMRLSLMLGQFNYGKSGILDATHVRLFTFKTMREALEDNGFIVESIQGIPVPFPLALGDTLLSRILLKLNEWAIALMPSLFSYQMGLIARPIFSVDKLRNTNL